MGGLGSLLTMTTSSGEEKSFRAFKFGKGLSGRSLWVIRFRVFACLFGCWTVCFRSFLL